MSSLLGDVDEVYQIYHEIDHLVELSRQAWDHRNGGHGTRNPLVQTRDIRIKFAPIKAPAGYGGKAPLVTAPPGRLADDSTSRKNRHAASLSIESTQRRPPLSVTGIIDNEFMMPDYVLESSPRLLDMQRENGNNSNDWGNIGPVNRSADLFTAVEVMMKLRWLLRLHCALVHLAGPRCSLRRLLMGALLDSCNVHPFSHPPVPVFELLTQTLRVRFTSAFPLLLGFVATHAQVPEPDATGASKDQVAQSARTPRQPVMAEPELYDDEETVAVRQAIDNLFISWLVQQDARKLMTMEVLQELDYYGIPRPVVQTTLDGLSRWITAKESGSAHRHIKYAQHEAHHLAIIFELPQLRPELQVNPDEVFEMARSIVAHPKTFNSGVRERIPRAMAEADFTVAADGSIPPLSTEYDEDQLSIFFMHHAHARDCGRVNPQKIDTWRDTRPPILIGRGPRYPGATRPWPPVLQHKLDMGKIGGKAGVPVRPSGTLQGSGRAATRSTG